MSSDANWKRYLGDIAGLLAAGVIGTLAFLQFFVVDAMSLPPGKCDPAVHCQHGMFYGVEMPTLAIFLGTWSAVRIVVNVIRRLIDRS